MFFSLLSRDPKFGRNEKSVFFGGFPWVFSKKARRGRSGYFVEETNIGSTGQTVLGHRPMNQNLFVDRRVSGKNKEHED